MDPLVTTEADISTMFDRIAPKYDFLNRMLSLRQDVRWRRSLARALYPYSPQDKMLDLATGTGDVILAMEAYGSQYGSYVGIDISEKMLEKAEPKLAKLPVSLLKGSATKIAFDEESFDSVTISFGLRNVIEKRQALVEIHRVLKPGGRFGILEFFSDHKSIQGKAFEFYFNHILPKIGGLLSDKDAYAYLPQSVQRFFQPTELVNLIQDIGMTKIVHRRFFGGCQLMVFQKTSK